MSCKRKSADDDDYQSNKQQSSTEKRKRSKKSVKMRCWAEPRYVSRCSGENVKEQPLVRVFVDGASSGNHHKRVSERVGGFGAYCEQTGWFHSARLRAPVTNNRAELQAVIMVLGKAIDDMDSTDCLGDEDYDDILMHGGSDGEKVEHELRIMGDNEYVLNIATQWLKAWRVRGYRKADGNPVLNLDLVKRLDHLLQEFVLRGRALSFRWVKAHADEPDDKESASWRNWFGNREADKLAVRGSKQNS